MLLESVIDEIGESQRATWQMAAPAGPALTGPGGSGRDDGHDGAADPYLVALLQPLGVVDAAVVEPGAIGRIEVFDPPEAMGELEDGVVAGGVLVVDGQRALPARGELGVEDLGLVAHLEGDRLRAAGLGQGGFVLAGDRGDGGPPG